NGGGDDGSHHRRAAPGRGAVGGGWFMHGCSSRALRANRAHNDGRGNGRRTAVGRCPIGTAPVVDEAALFRALESGHLAGAGLDVFDPEPPEPDNPLLKMKNVVVTPHIASGTDRGVYAMMDGTATQVIQLLKGERPTWLVNPDVWPGRLQT
ncbi:MAG: hypothetical protein HC802_08575, partial [Caldilineaceae bacterium]|nr:hypothetical protein [Caldilineaceae bacterium]